MGGGEKIGELAEKRGQRRGSIDVGEKKGGDYSLKYVSC